jgi:hypothetical protein
MPCVLGQALSMQAIHGGQAKHDTLASQNMAARLRGGMLPQASGDPADMRATRDLLRRRTHLRRTRAALLAHGQQTPSPDNRPAIGKQIADNANRDGVAARVVEPAVQQRLDVDWALIPSDDPRLGD